MNIWLLIDGKKDGPHHDFEVRSMINNGDLEPEVLAWHEGMDEWKPIGEIGLFEDSFKPEETETDEEESDENIEGEANTEKTQVVVDESDVKRYLEHLASQENKSSHVPPRKYTAEGQPVTTLYDGETGVFLWRRGVGRTLDVIFLFFILFMTAVFSHRNPVDFMLDPTNGYFFLSFFLMYELITIHLFGTSIGKAIMGIRIESFVGPNLGFGRSLLRGFVVVITLMIFWNVLLLPLLFAMCIFFEKRRKLLPWDIYGSSIARGLPMSKARIIGAIMFLLALLMLASLITPPSLVEKMQDSLQEMQEKLNNE